MAMDDFILTLEDYFSTDCSTWWLITRLTSFEVHLLTPETIEFKRGIVVVPAYLAKGLEFDGVVVYNVNSEAYSSDAERNILYTVCTRSLHRLILHYHGELSPLIREVNPQLYTGN